MIAFEARLIHDWDQTALVAQQTHNLGTILINVNRSDKSPPAKPKDMYDFHPLRQRPRAGMKVTRKNFGVLRMLGDAMVG